MIASIHRFAPPITVEAVSEKAPERVKVPVQESKAFYIVTGLLVLASGILAAIALVAVAVVFWGGVQ